MSEQPNYAVLDADVENLEIPDLDGPGLYQVEVTKQSLYKTRKQGWLFKTEYKVLSSTHKGSPVGSIRAFKVFDCFGELGDENKGLTMKKMRGILSGVGGYDPNSKQQWAQVAKFAAEKNIFGAGVKNAKGELIRGGRGVILDVKVDAPKLSKRGNSYCVAHFSKAEETV